jgi:CheY-like chemotaxis protein
MSRRRVLLVEDDEDIRDAVAYILRREGHEVLEASHGGEALDRILAHGQPDLILLDMNMPVMNGWELAAELKRRALTASPIVVLTAAHDAQRSAVEIGAAGFIGKPFSLEDLVTLTAAHLAGGAAHAR